MSAFKTAIGLTLSTFAVQQVRSLRYTDSDVNAVATAAVTRTGHCPHDLRAQPA